jgi:hypothetical protein
VGDFGTWTPVPAGAPFGTEVINIPGASWWDGQSGLFKVTFTLPVLGPNVLLTGWANVDDFGRAFLNGQPLTPSMASGAVACHTLASGAIATGERNSRLLAA